MHTWVTAVVILPLFLGSTRFDPDYNLAEIKGVIIHLHRAETTMPGSEISSNTLE